MLFLSEKLVRCLNKRAEMVDSISPAQACSVMVLCAQNYVTARIGPQWLIFFSVRKVL